MHHTQHCKSGNVCRTCSKRHHTLIHLSNNTNSNEHGLKREFSTPSTSTANSSNAQSGLSKTEAESSSHIQTFSAFGTSSINSTVLLSTALMKSKIAEEAFKLLDV